jgi:hypothetical protein
MHEKRGYRQLRGELADKATFKELRIVFSAHGWGWTKSSRSQHTLLDGYEGLLCRAILSYFQGSKALAYE